MKYYRLLDDINFAGRWHLQGVMNTNPWPLVSPPMLPMKNPLRSSVLEVQVQVGGKLMDYTTTSQASVPIVSFRALQAIDGMGGFTAFPVRLLDMDRPQKTSYHLMHFWDVVDCVDEARSEFEKFEIDDLARPDLAGQYSAFYKLVIDPKRIAGKHVFRVARATTYVVVSEKVKDSFEAAGVTGAVFQAVN